MIFVYLLIGVMPLTHHRIWSSSESGLTVVKYLGLVCVLYAIVHVFLAEDFPPLFGARLARWFVLLYAIVALSHFTTSNQTGLLEPGPFLSYTSFLLLYFTLICVVDSFDRLRWVLLVTVGSVAFASLYMIREWQVYHSIYKGFRPGWISGDPNYFSISAVIAIPIAVQLLTTENRPVWERFFCTGCLAISLLGLTLAASRGGLLGLAVAVLYCIGRSRRRLRGLAAIAILGLPLLLLAPASPLRRLMEPSPGDVAATHSRIVVWKASLRMVREHPLFGIGLGNFKPSVMRYENGDEGVQSVAHNVYFEIATELGLPALLIFLALLASSFRTLSSVGRRALDSGDEFLRNASIGLQASLLGCGVSLFFVSGQYEKMVWLAVFLPAAMLRVAGDAEPELIEEAPD